MLAQLRARYKVELDESVFDRPLLVVGSTTEKLLKDEISLIKTQTIIHRRDETHRIPSDDLSIALNLFERHD